MERKSDICVWLSNDISSDESLLISFQLPRLNEENSLRFQKKRMSKREKKKLAKKQAESASQIKENGDEKIAQRLYTEMPETSFTRSISNPGWFSRRDSLDVNYREVELRLSHRNGAFMT